MTTGLIFFQKIIPKNIYSVKLKLLMQRIMEQGI